jgi:hypothetical protein
MDQPNQANSRVTNRPTANGPHARPVRAGWSLTRTGGARGTPSRLGEFVDSEQQENLLTNRPIWTVIRRRSLRVPSRKPWGARDAQSAIVRIGLQDLTERSLASV